MQGKKSNIYMLIILCLFIITILILILYPKRSSEVGGNAKFKSLLSDHDDQNTTTSEIATAFTTTFIPSSAKTFIYHHTPSSSFNETTNSTKYETHVVIENERQNVLQKIKAIETNLEFHKSYHGSDDYPYCSSADCRKMASRMLDMIDHSEDSCQNFFTYSCGGVANDNTLKSKNPNTEMDNLLRDILNQFPSLVPSIFYNSCISWYEDDLKNRSTIVKDHLFLDELCNIKPNSSSWNEITTLIAYLMQQYGFNDIINVSLSSVPPKSMVVPKISIAPHSSSSDEILSKLESVKKAADWMNVGDIHETTKESLHMYLTAINKEKMPYELMVLHNESTMSKNFNVNIYDLLLSIGVEEAALENQRYFQTSIDSSKLNSLFDKLSSEAFHKIILLLFYEFIYSNLVEANYERDLKQYCLVETKLHLPDYLATMIVENIPKNVFTKNSLVAKSILQEINKAYEIDERPYTMKHLSTLHSLKTKYNLQTMKTILHKNKFQSKSYFSNLLYNNERILHQIVNSISEPASLLNNCWLVYASLIRNFGVSFEEMHLEYLSIQQLFPPFSNPHMTSLPHSFSFSQWGSQLARKLVDKQNLAFNDTTCIGDYLNNTFDLITNELNLIYEKELLALVLSWRAYETTFKEIISNPEHLISTEHLIWLGDEPLSPQNNFLLRWAQVRCEGSSNKIEEKIVNVIGRTFMTLTNAVKCPPPKYKFGCSLQITEQHQRFINSANFLS